MRLPASLFLPLLKKRYSVMSVPIHPLIIIMLCISGCIPSVSHILMNLDLAPALLKNPPYASDSGPSIFSASFGTVSHGILISCLAGTGVTDLPGSNPILQLLQYIQNSAA